MITVSRHVTTRLTQLALSQDQHNRLWNECPCSCSHWYDERLKKCCEAVKVPQKCMSQCTIMKSDKEVSNGAWNSLQEAIKLFSGHFYEWMRHRGGTIRLFSQPLLERLCSTLTWATPSAFPTWSLFSTAKKKARTCVPVARRWACRRVARRCAKGVWTSSRCVRGETTLNVDNRHWAFPHCNTLERSAAVQESRLVLRELRRLRTGEALAWILLERRPWYWTHYLRLFLALQRHVFGLRRERAYVQQMLNVIFVVKTIEGSKSHSLLSCEGWFQRLCMT